MREMNFYPDSDVFAKRIGSFCELMLFQGFSFFDDDKVIFRFRLKIEFYVWNS